MISLTLYNVTYLLSQALGVFAIYKLMKAFFNERAVNNNVEVVSFIIYYAITSSVYLILNIPYINFSINFVATFLLTFLYRASLKKKIFVCFMVYVFGFCTEMLVAALTGYVNFPVNGINDYNSIYGVVSANVLLLVAIMANGFKNIKSDDVLPKSSWLALLTVPIFSLFILSMLFSLEGLTEYGVIFSITAILAMNFTVFFLFDRIAKLYCEKHESILIKQQNKYYVNQLLLLEKLHETSGKLRHDIKNHLITIDSYLEKRDIDGARNHISSDGLSPISGEKNNLEILKYAYGNSGRSLPSKAPKIYTCAPSFFINTIGDIKPCQGLNSIILGNIRSMNLIEAFESDGFRKVRNAICKNNIDTCKICEFRFVCEAKNRMCFNNKKSSNDGCIEKIVYQLYLETLKGDEYCD